MRSESREPLQRSGGLCPVSVLIVEDDQPFIELLRHWLGEGPIRVARTLAEAAEMIAASAPRVVLLDLTLPDSCAANTLARLRELKKAASDALVIVVTGNPLASKQAMAAGADHFVTKDDLFFDRVDGILDSNCKCAQPPELDETTVEKVERTVREIVTA